MSLSLWNSNVVWKSHLTNIWKYKWEAQHIRNELFYTLYLIGIPLTGDTWWCIYLWVGVCIDFHIYNVFLNNISQALASLKNWELYGVRAYFVFIPCYINHNPVELHCDISVILVIVVGALSQMKFYFFPLLSHFLMYNTLLCFQENYRNC